MCALVFTLHDSIINICFQWSKLSKSWEKTLNTKMTSTIWKYPLINEILGWNYTKMKGKILGFGPLQKPFRIFCRKKSPRKHGLWTRFAKLIKNTCSCKFSKNIKITNFQTSYMSCDQIWLYFPLDGYHCGYATPKKNHDPNVS
jgi:hypothetical protein